MPETERERENTKKLVLKRRGEFEVCLNCTRAEGEKKQADRERARRIIRNGKWEIQTRQANGQTKSERVRDRNRWTKIFE